jgi:hypothetical protein
METRKFNLHNLIILIVKIFTMLIINSPYAKASFCVYFQRSPKAVIAVCIAAI